MDTAALETLAETLEASGRYRVLRRLDPPPITARPSDLQSLAPGARLALYLDLETTGLDPRRDEVIEIALVPFAYDAAGAVLGVFEPFTSFNEPSRPVPSPITRLTGITDEMVKGARIETAVLEALVASAALIVAHNAAFDRRFAERLSPSFAAKPWACSMCEIDWALEGYEGQKLAYLASAAGFFYDRHRAVSDCYAGITLLQRPLPVSGACGMARLLETARKPLFRIFAENAPFELKEALKSRGYRWNGEVNGRPRAWYRDVDEAGRDPEMTFLETEIYGREAELTVRRITALERFSERA